MITKKNATKTLQTLKAKSWMTYDDLNKATGMNRSYLQRIISGAVKNPSKATVMRIYQALIKDLS